MQLHLRCLYSKVQHTRLCTWSHSTSWDVSSQKQPLSWDTWGQGPQKWPVVVGHKAAWPSGNYLEVAYWRAERARDRYDFLTHFYTTVRAPAERSSSMPSCCMMSPPVDMGEGGGVEGPHTWRLGLPLCLTGQVCFFSSRGLVETRTLWE